MSRQHPYWAYWGIPGGLFQAFMAAVIIISGTGLILGIARACWLTF